VPTDSGRLDVRSMQRVIVSFHSMTAALCCRRTGRPLHETSTLYLVSWPLVQAGHEGSACVREGAYEAYVCANGRGMPGHEGEDALRKGHVGTTSGCVTP